MSMDANGIINNLAAKAEKNLTIRENDFKDENGFWVCGICGKPKQIYLEQFKRVVVCACDCDIAKMEEENRRQKQQEEMEVVRTFENVSLLTKKYRNATFENYEKRKTNENNFKLCYHYAKDFDDMLAKGQRLLLWGDVGTGKTYAAACIVNYLLDRGIPAVMTSLIKLVDQIQYGYEKETDIINRLKRVKLLVLDDLGAERGTDYSLERAYSILDARVSSELPLITTTNRTIEEMLNETDMRYKRIYERAYDKAYQIQFTGVSWRKAEAGKMYEEMEKILKKNE